MKKNIMWNTFGSIFYCMCQWLITILIVHLSGFGDAGYLSLAMTTSSSFSAISLFSMRNFQISDTKEEFSSGEYVGSRIITSITAFLLCSIYALVSQSILQAVCIIAFMIIRVAEAFVDVFHGINQKYDHYDYIGISYVLRGMVTIIIFSLGLYVWKNLVVTLFIVAGLNLLVAFSFDARKTSQLEKLKIVLWNEKIVSLLKNCLPLVIITFLLSLMAMVPKTELQNLFGEEVQGIYSSIASPTMIVQVFASVVFNPFIPGISSLYNEKKYTDFICSIHKMYLAFIALIVVVVVGATLLGKWGLSLLFGAEILNNYDLFMPIVYCTILLAFCWIMMAIVIAMRKIKILLVGMLVDFAILLLINHPLIKAYEGNGTSLVQIIAYGIFGVFMIVICELNIWRKKKEI